MIKWFKKLFSKETHPVSCSHDWDMTFPEGGLNWEFVCTKCGQKRRDMPRL